ncbi:MAG: hypothetical protein UHU21_17165, partial [Lachnospiraceae bacterium]|nr:hypothetical protein [Lachnospiraceae bacterium]
ANSYLPILFTSLWSLAPASAAKRQLCIRERTCILNIRKVRSAETVIRFYASQEQGKLIPG